MSNVCQEETRGQSYLILLVRIESNALRYFSSIPFTLSRKSGRAESFLLSFLTYQLLFLQAKIYLLLTPGPNSMCSQNKRNVACFSMKCIHESISVVDLILVGPRQWHTAPLCLLVKPALRVSLNRVVIFVNPQGFYDWNA